jgi:hypothetical protein
VPLPLWQAVHATASAPPFLAWSADAGVQQAFREELALALFGRLAGPIDPVRNLAAAAPPGTRATVELGIDPVRNLAAAAPALVANTFMAARRMIGGGAEGGGIADTIRHRAEELDLPPIALNALLTEFRPADMLHRAASAILPGRAEPSGHAESSG